MSTPTSIKVMKCVAFIVGIPVAILGPYAHFTSAWTQYTFMDITFKPHLICEHDIGRPCPKIEMERFYVGVVLLLVAISSLGAGLSFCCNLVKQPIKTIDIIWHFGAALLLLSAAVVFIISAVQINNLFNGKWDWERNSFGLWKVDASHGILEFRRNEKIIAGALTILLSLMHLIAGILFVREPSHRGSGNQDFPGVHYSQPK